MKSKSINKEKTMKELCRQGSQPLAPKEYTIPVWLQAVLKELSSQYEKKDGYLVSANN
jgi:hypothetical protein